MPFCGAVGLGWGTEPSPARVDAGPGKPTQAGEMRPGRSVPCRAAGLVQDDGPGPPVAVPGCLWGELPLAPFWLGPGPPPGSRAVLFAASGRGGQPWARLSEAGPALTWSPPSCLARALALPGGTSEVGRPVGSTPWFCARSNPGSLALGWLPPELALFRLKNKCSYRMTVKILSGVAVAL